MGLLDTLSTLRGTLGGGAKFAATQVLNVCLPGSGAVVELVGQLLSDPEVKEAAKGVADAIGKINEERWKAEVKTRFGTTEERLEEVEAVLEVLRRDMAGLLAEVSEREGQSAAEVRRLIEAEIAARPEWQQARETLRSVVKRVESLEEWRERLRSQGLTTGFMGRQGAKPAGGPGVGDTLDGWHLHALAGHGGMGRVFRATKGGDTKAVKVMSPELSGDPAFEARFRREMMALARLDPHPGLVGIEDFGKCGRFGCWYLVMPFVEGETLQARLERSGALGADAAREVFAGLAGALASAHGRGVFHRDIKPANVILTADGRAVLVDFGVARVAGGSGATGLSAYTALFAAPEQMRTGHADARSDVYSLAATLYYALKYDDPSARDPHRFKPDRVPEAFRPVLTAALANDPTDRPAESAALYRRVVGNRSIIPTSEYVKAADKHKSQEEVGRADKRYSARRDILKSMTSAIVSTWQKGANIWWAVISALGFVAAVVIGIALGEWRDSTEREQSKKDNLSIAESVAAAHSVGQIEIVFRYDRFVLVQPKMLGLQEVRYEGDPFQHSRGTAYYPWHGEQLPSPTERLNWEPADAATVPLVKRVNAILNHCGREYDKRYLADYPHTSYGDYIIFGLCSFALIQIGYWLYIFVRE